MADEAPAPVVMPSNYGRIEEFDEHSEDWIQYTERLEFYFTANNIDNAEKKRAILLSVCGKKTYKLMRNLCAPQKPGEKTFNELVQLVKNHQNPKPSETVQRYKFNTRERNPNESISMFVAELRNISEHCNFGVTLEDMLRDKLVCGIKDDRIQRRLLAEPQLKFPKAMEIATAMETAAKNAQDLQTPESKPTVHKLTFKQEECYRCGGNHRPHECKWKDAKCYICDKKGHLAKKCRNKGRQHPAYVKPKNKHQTHTGYPKTKRKQQKAHFIEEDDSECEETYTMHQVQSEKRKPYRIKAQLNKTEIEMEIDTGAAISIISQDTLKRIFGSEEPKLTQTGKLRTYTGEELGVLGKTTVSVMYNNQSANLPITVVRGTGPSLMGRDWLEHLNLDWKSIFRVDGSTNNTNRERDSELEAILCKYPEVFKEGLGTLKGTKAKIHITQDAVPKYYKARPVPYALKEKIEQELDRLEKEGTIEPVQFSEWAAPIVPIVKEDKSVRICGDYKVTINQASKLDNYPIPKTDDLYATLSGGQVFSKLDLSHAYQQILLDDDSRDFVTINTHKGLYRYNRLPYGVSSAPGIFQRTMENVLQGIPNVVVRVDDILITGRTNDEHFETLDKVLCKLQNAGMRLNKKKCVFLVPEVVYLGHKVNSQGIYPVEDKVTAINEAPVPQNVTELKSYLGMLNYYNRFLPDLSTKLAPLHELLQKQTKWKWGKAQQEAFDKSKLMLQSSKVLMHYDPSRELLLSCDASTYGIGAVLSHRMDDGTDRPIGYVSRTLAPAEKNYSVLEKEGLAIIFAVKKFHQYLYGRKFKIFTDHKPLVGLFNEIKPIPVMAAARLQRWALILSAYEYSIVYKEGKNNANADGLSRLPLNYKTEPEVPGEMILLMEHMDLTPVTSRQIKSWTRKDPILSRVMNFVLQGWPASNTDDQVRPYFTRKLELSLYDGCILWGNRVVIPPPGRDTILQELHEGHPGVTRMKMLARSYVWWPNMDSELDKKVKSCHECQVNRHAPAEAPLHPWEWPEKPWSRLHIDYAGPLHGKMYLVCVDAHSKYIEVQVVNSATSTATIEKLRMIFATHGIPDTIVSDNGTPFTSEEFEIFTKRNGIRHIRISPYQPSSNGLAERAVQTFKEGFKKMKEGSIETRIARFLFAYRITPHATTGLPPSVMLMGRRPRSLLDLTYPDLQQRVRQKQQVQKQCYDKGTKNREFDIGDEVYIVNHSKVITTKWISGTIIKQNGPVTFCVKLSDGRIVKRHQNQMRHKYDNVMEERLDMSEIPDIEIPSVPEITIVSKDNENQGLQISKQTVASPKPNVNSRPKRTTRPPNRYGEFVYH